MYIKKQSAHDLIIQDSLHGHTHAMQTHTHTHTHTDSDKMVYLRGRISSTWRSNKENSDVQGKAMLVKTISHMTNMFTSTETNKHSWVTTILCSHACYCIAPSFRDTFFQIGFLKHFPKKNAFVDDWLCCSQHSMKKNFTCLISMVGVQSSKTTNLCSLMYKSVHHVCWHVCWHGSNTLCLPIPWHVRIGTTRSTYQCTRVTFLPWLGITTKTPL